MSLKKKLAFRVFPKYSRLIDEVNHNAKVGQWIRDHKPSTRLFETRIDLYKYVNTEMCQSGPIDYLEFGVYRGDSIRSWAEINKADASRFVGFDSFEGLPETWNRQNAAGTFDVRGQVPVVNDARVEFVKGWFQHSLRPWLDGFKPKGRLVIHNDSDLHSSTLFLLTVLDPLIVPGTVLIFDEFSSPLHEFRAYQDYMQAYIRKAELVAMTEDYASQVAFVFTV